MSPLVCIISIPVGGRVAGGLWARTPATYLLSRLLSAVTLPFEVSLSHVSTMGNSISTLDGLVRSCISLPVGTSSCHY